MAKQIRVKHGINTAVSLALVVGTDTDPETGETLVFEQEEIFLPGAVLPPNLAERHAEDAENPESHLFELLEVFEGEDVEEIIPEPNAPGINPPAPEPTTPEEPTEVPPATEPPVVEPEPVVPEVETPVTPEPQIAENTTITGDDTPVPATQPDAVPTPATAQPGEAPVNPFAPTDDAA